METLSVKFMVCFRYDSYAGDSSDDSDAGDSDDSGKKKKKEKKEPKVCVCVKRDDWKSFKIIIFFICIYFGSDFYILIFSIIFLRTLISNFLQKPKAKTVSEKPRKKRQKKEKDENKPKRAQSAYFIWLNEHREQIKKENPGISITELSKLAGQKWRELKDRKVSFLKLI